MGSECKGKTGYPMKDPPYAPNEWHQETAGLRPKELAIAGAMHHLTENVVVGINVRNQSDSGYKSSPENPRCFPTPSTLKHPEQQQQQQPQSSLKMVCQIASLRDPL